MNLVQNQVTLIGYLGADPTTMGEGDRAGARFDLATTERFGKGQDRKERTDWHRIVCWNGQAKSCAHLAKGDRVAVFGKLRSNSWEDSEGQRRYTVEVEARDIAFLNVKAFDRAEEPGD